MGLMLESTQDVGSSPPISPQIYAPLLPEAVRLIAVSKQVDVERMRLAYQAGIRDFAENRVQELQSKRKQLEDLKDVNWHFIGRLQSNKARKAVQLADWIHSVDHLELAQTLDRLAEEEGRTPQVLLQVKLAEDPNKGGWLPEDLENHLPELVQLTHLDLRGLMTIAPWGLDEAQTTELFQSLSHWTKRWQSQGYRQLTELSMGMSGDYPLAILAGATMVRLGQAIFGSRTCSPAS
ncbi:YggS family pyridoxal phosphate-dependent enzyme [Anthocerotibacter panamensis]|uniref:YggS family pyridoxal phosphate-dependent enzyme n=1 Tax=Anthocerotibacter panamensis TaxID=2857077 RepID=UPI001FD9B9FB|nr:YggS family pyridoxal phosphate-dependent enzyme [Anthocerotibacter panamensis]